MKASEVIRIGPEAQPRRLHRRGRGRQALLVLQHRVLDDQDRVLRRQAEQRHQADLEVDVVGQAAQPDRGERAEGAEGQRQQHRQRQRPLLVLRGEDQEHHQRAEREHQHRGAAGLLLLERGAAPVEAEVRRQHLAPRCARSPRSPRPSSRPACRRPRTCTAGRLLKRVMRARAARVLDARERAQRDHLALFAAHVDRARRPRGDCASSGSADISTCQVRPYLLKSFT